MDFNAILGQLPFGQSPMFGQQGQSGLPAIFSQGFSPSAGGGRFGDIMKQLGSGLHQQQDNGSGLSAYHPIHDDIFAQMLNYLGQL
jgi:hypothetical protein